MFIKKNVFEKNIFTTKKLIEIIFHFITNFKLFEKNIQRINNFYLISFLLTRFETGYFGFDIEVITLFPFVFFG